ncbi:hypothetical protein ACTA71_003525 [Dictyostelium dimigraforme]
MLNSVGGSVATKVGASFLPESSVLKTVAKYAAWATGALLVLLGGISIFDSHWIIGPICIALGGVMLVIEFAVPFAAQFQLFLTVFEYKIRGIMYVCFCIPAFFTVFTIAPGLGCIFSGGIYVILGFIKNEKAELPQYNKQRDVEGGHMNSSDAN